MNRYRDIAVTWFALGLIAGVILATPTACQHNTHWHITEGTR